MIQGNITNPPSENCGGLGAAAQAVLMQQQLDGHERPRRNKEGGGWPGVCSQAFVA